MGLRLESVFGRIVTGITGEDWCHMKFCQHCDSRVKKSAHTCETCGAMTSRGKRSILAGVVFVATAAIIFFIMRTELNQVIETLST